MLTRIADIAEPLPRTLAWSAAWEMTREAELKARDFVALVAAGVHAETEVGVAQRLLLQAQTALSSYADPDWACSDGWPPFADRLLELARGAEPGSDHQLAYVNALCTSVLSPRHAAVLAALLDTDPAELGLAGLVVDTDLRWRIVTALAAAGDVDADGPETPFIDAEVERDPTAAGKRNAAAGRGGAPAARGQGQRRGSRSSRTTRCPTSPPARSSPASCSPVRRRCCSRSRRATSTPSPACGSGAPARSRRRW